MRRDILSCGPQTLDMYRNTIRVVSFRTRTIYDNPRLYRRITTSPRVLSSDPWPLPHSPEHLSSTTTPPTRTQIPPLPRHNEDEGTIRARLVYQSRKRGTLESDLLLSTFAKEYLDDMSLDELREYDKVSSGSFESPENMI